MPLEYLTGSGDKAGPVVALTWGVLAISLGVIIVITALLLGGVWKSPSRTVAIGEKTAIGPEEGGLNWLWIGVGVSSLVLLFAVVWTVVVLAKVIAPTTRPTVTIEITGKQWWWQAKYDSPDPSRVFLTANEIHIPAGQPVRLRLIGGDVIHSFWVPQLSGKTDAIPGQINETWIEAKHPGIYRGQCTEYCGVQHAHMGIRVGRRHAGKFPRMVGSPIAVARRGGRTRCRGIRRALRRLPCGARHDGGGIAGTGPFPSDDPHHHRGIFSQ